MSLRHGLLGLLAEGPASGYDLTRRFQEFLGPVWPAGHPQIYAELSRLTSDGLIQVESEGPRGRKAYEITPAGLEEVRRWLAAVEVDHTMRLQPLLRAMFFWLMDPDDLQAHLAAEERRYREQAAAYRAYAEAKDRGDFGFSPHTQSLRIAIEAAIRLYQSMADWAAWARDHPPTSEPAEQPAGQPDPPDQTG